MVAALALVLVGCSEEAATGPTAQDMKAERQQLAAKIKKGSRARGRKKVEVVAPDSAEAKGSFASVDADYSYDSTDRRDPFQPYRIETAAVDEEVGGPLEQFELEQLAVVALVWDANRPRAIVTDPGGTSYVVRVGSRMGKNEGRVIHIGDNLVLVKETYVDYAGDQSTKDVELRIRRSQGG